MTKLRSSLLVPLLVLSMAACKGSSEPAGSDASPAAPPEPPVELTAADLPDLVLQPDEAPEGLASAEGIGTPTLEEFWLAECCQPQQDAFRDAGFAGAASAFYEAEGRAKDPAETAPGFAFVSSSAVLFADDESAAEAMRIWNEFFGDDSFTVLPAEGLGDEGFASTGTPRAPEETLVLYFWRQGSVVQHLRAAGGGIGESDVRPLVGAMAAG